MGEYEGEEIELELEDNEPVYIPSRPIPYALREQVGENIREMEQKGIIETSRGSGYNSPIHLVKMLVNLPCPLLFAFETLYYQKGGN